MTKSQKAHVNILCTDVQGSRHLEVTVLHVTWEALRLLLKDTYSVHEFHKLTDHFPNPLRAQEGRGGSPAGEARAAQ